MAKKMKRVLIKPVRDGRMWVGLGVQQLATERELRVAVSRWLYSFNEWRGPRRSSPRGRKFFLGRTIAVNEFHRPVKATIAISSYLTKQVPKRLRERVFTIRSEGEALVCAADMYRKVYEENERLGGESALQPDVKARVSGRRKQSKKDEPVLVNRGFDPYVWGHDLGDLVFESIHLKWTSDRAVHVTFGIGS